MGSLAGSEAAPLMPVDPGDSSAVAVPVDAEAFPPPREAWYTLGVVAVITAFALLDQNILGLLIQQIKADFHLTVRPACCSGRRRRCSMPSWPCRSRATSTAGRASGSSWAAWSSGASPPRRPAL